MWPWRLLAESEVVNISDLFGYIPGILLKPCNYKELPALGVVCWIKEIPNLIRKADLLALSITKGEASQQHFDQNCKHSPNFMCHAHNMQACNWDDQNLVEVTQMFLQCIYIAGLVELHAAKVAIDITLRQSIETIRDLRQNIAELWTVLVVAMTRLHLVYHKLHSMSKVVSIR